MITTEGGYSSFEGHDLTLYFSQFETPGIWKLDREGGPSELVIADFNQEDAWNWRVTDKSIYFMDRNAATLPSVSRFDIQTKRRFLVATMPSATCMRVDVSPSGDWLVFAQVDHGGRDIMLVETNY